MDNFPYFGKNKLHASIFSYGDLCRSIFMGIHELTTTFYIIHLDLELSLSTTRFVRGCVTTKGTTSNNFGSVTLILYEASLVSLSTSIYIKFVGPSPRLTIYKRYALKTTTVNEKNTSVLRQPEKMMSKKHRMSHPKMQMMKMGYKI